MDGRVITTKSTRAWLDDEGILHAEALPGSVHTKAQIEADLALIWELVERRKRPVLVDARHIKGIDREARVFCAGPEMGRLHAATALLVGSPLSRVVGNFFVGLNKNTQATRLFTSEPEALTWLRGYVE